MRKTKFVAIGSLVIIISVMVFAGLGTSLWGVELHSIESDIAEIEDANRRMEEEIITKTSLTELYEMRDQLGFARPEGVIYVEDSSTVASR